MTRPNYPKSNGTLRIEGLTANVTIKIAAIEQTDNSRTVEVSFVPKDDKGKKALANMTTRQLFMAAHTLIEELVIQVNIEGGGEESEQGNR